MFTPLLCVFWVDPDWSKPSPFPVTDWSSSSHVTRFQPKKSEGSSAGGSGRDSLATYWNRSLLCCPMLHKMETSFCPGEMPSWGQSPASEDDRTQRRKHAGSLMSSFSYWIPNLQVSLFTWRSALSSLLQPFWVEVSVTCSQRHPNWCYLLSACAWLISDREPKEKCQLEWIMRLSFVSFIFPAFEDTPILWEKDWAVNANRQSREQRHWAWGL